MCGITGYYSFDNSFNPENLKIMSSSLAHRGPDNESFFYDKSIGLAHRRLSIIDLSNSANQPMKSASGKHIIIFNGEIYNFKEIATELNCNLKTSSDTEVIIEAFEKWGVDFVNKLNGMFAIAIYQIETEKLFLFRDRMGVKPLFYYFENGLFLFSSEIKSISSIEEIKNNLTINKKAVKEYFYRGYIPQPYTIYNEIKKFPSATNAIVEKNKISLFKYWDINNKINETKFSDYNEVKSNLKSLLESSVKYRLISDVPFGTFLSGGIDSSIVTAIAQHVSEKQLNTFTIRFNEAKYNEADFAKKIADYLNTNHHEFTVNYSEAIGLVNNIINAYDEPYADSSAIPTLLVSKLARKYVTMTLSGDGGDELFHGYGAYDWANRLNNPIIKTLRRPIGYGLSLLNDKYRRAAKVFDYPNKNFIKSHIFSQEQYFFSLNEIEELIINNNSIIDSDNDYNNLNRKLTVAESQAFFDINYYLKDDLLVKVDRASMQYSLENRVPFMDYRLVEFALNIDAELKIKNGEKKYILKQALYDYLPKEFFNRPKWGFSIPLKIWLKNELKYLIEENLDRNSIENTGFLNYNKIEELKNKFFNGQEYLYNRIWTCIIFVKWYKANVNN